MKEKPNRGQLRVYSDNGVVYDAAYCKCGSEQFIERDGQSNVFVELGARGWKWQAGHGWQCPSCLKTRP